MEEKPHVLLVEDGLLLRFVMAELLLDSGFKVTVAGDANEALDLIEAGMKFNAVVTDIDMAGDMDGVDMAKEIKLRFPLLPILFVSGKDVHSSDLPPGCPFLPKPVSERLLVALVKRLVGTS